MKRALEKELKGTTTIRKMFTFSSNRFLSILMIVTFILSSPLATILLAKETRLKSINSDRRLPIILIPGYAASILSVEEISKPGKVVRNLYETYPDSTFGMRMMACSIVNEVEMDSFVARENGWNIISPTMERYGLYAVDNLNPNSDIGLGPKRLYLHEMIDYLKSIGYEEGVTLFAFPYDWRDSIINSAYKLSTYIGEVKEKVGKKVNIISHSMGGYVSKTAYVVDRELYKSVNIHISFATPWQGTGRDWVISSLFGGNLNNLKLDALAMRDVTLGSIAHYERMVIGNLAKNVGGKISPKITVNGVVVTEDQMVQGLKAFLKENTVYYGENNEKSQVVPFRDDIYTSKSYNRIIRQIFDYGSQSRQDQPSYFYNIIGRDKPTPISVILKGDGIFVDEKSNVIISNISRISYANDDYISGDGLATYQSVETDGFEATQRISFPYSHNGILKSSDSMLAIKYYLEENCHIIGKWIITLKDSNNKTTTETVLIKETYNWIAHSNWFNMNGTYFGDKWKGSVEIEGKSADFSIDLNQEGSSGDGSCVLSSMSGYISDVSTGTRVYTVNGQRETSIHGGECNTDLNCPVKNGKGIRKCILGFLIDTCIISRCDEGYKLSVGQPVIPSTCTEENLNWMLAPILISSFVGTFLLCLFVSIIACGVIHCIKSKTASTYREI